MVESFQLNVRISHWFPIITRCPVNGLPDVLYVYVHIIGFAELYSVRKKLFRGFFLRKMFMEDVAKEIAKRATDARMDLGEVRVVLLGGRHEVRIRCA